MKYTYLNPHRNLPNAPILDFFNSVYFVMYL